MSTDDLIKVLKEVGKIPEVKRTFISKVGKGEQSEDLYIETLWTFKNYMNNESNTLHSSYIYNLKQNKIHSSLPTILDKRIIFTAVSPCDSKSACLLQDDKCCYLNVFSEGELTISVNLKEEDVHGKVYKNSDLSSFCWSSDSKFIMFVAEKKRPKSSSFLSKKSESTKDGWGNKYTYIDDWGEQMTDQSTSVIVVVDTTSAKVKVIDLPVDLCAGQVVWTPEGSLVGVAFVTSPYRLGMIYCKIRESVLFHMTLDGNFVELIPRGSCVQSPRFSPDGSSLIFLRGSVGGPHVNNMQLCLKKWKPKEDMPIEVLIDFVDKEQKIADDTLFYGLYGSSTLPLRCWSDDSRTVVFTSCDYFAATTYVINVETKTIHEVPSKESSLIAHDVRANYILASRSSLTEPSRILLIPLTSGIPGDAIAISQPKNIEGIPLEWQDHWTFINPNPHPNEVVSQSPVSALYLGPTQVPPGTSKKRPLIVWPHGGPHTMIQNTFIPSAAFFVRLGYSVLFPNYRGSIGQGKLALESLPGNCGSTDVSDVYEATRCCLERYSNVLDKSQVVLHGGSHGGFLVTHLAAQHPELYKVVSTRNPVTNLALMTGSSDIPDWCFVESGNKYQMEEPSSGQVLSRMNEMSPLSIVSKVKAPILFLLGNEDRRVPSSQGLFYHKYLLARKIETKACIYDDCHPLSKPDVEADCLIQTELWFRRFL